MIYFIQAGEDGPIKIGYVEGEDRLAVDLRLRLLQVGNHEALRLLATQPGALYAEQLLHTAFAKWRIRGEWFRPDALGLAETIAFAKPAEGETSWALRADGEQICEWCRSAVVPLGRRSLCSVKCANEKRAADAKVASQ